MKFNLQQVKYILETLSNTPAADIDSDEFEVEWGDDDGREGFAAHSISDSAGMAIEHICNLERQRDELLDALEGYMGAVSRMNDAMESGINVHGAIAEIVGWTDMANFAIAKAKGGAA